MACMTPTPFEPARDTAGRFAPQDHTAPEVGLTEAYLEDTSDGAEFDIDDYYNAVLEPDSDATQAFEAWTRDHRSVDAADAGIGQIADEDFFRAVMNPNPEEQAAFEAFLEERRDAPQGIDEYFAQPEPELVGGETPIGAWGNNTPF